MRFSRTHEVPRRLWTANTLADPFDDELRDLRHAGCGKLSQINGKGVAIQLTGPCRDTETIGGDHRCKPDADHRSDSQEEVQRSAVIEGCVLEEQSTFVLPELVSEIR